MMNDWQTTCLLNYPSIELPLEKYNKLLMKWIKFEINLKLPFGRKSAATKMDGKPVRNKNLLQKKYILWTILFKPTD